MRRSGSQPDNPNPSASHPSVDAYFDRELTPDSIESLLSSLDRSNTQRKQFNDTQSMLDGLRTPMDTPDISGRIIGELADRRGWLSSNGRRMVFAGRLATAACLLLVVTGLLLVRRHNPEAFQTANTAGPVGEFVEASGVEAGASYRAIRDGICTIEERCKPAVAMAAISVSSCETACGSSRRVIDSTERDFSIALSPGVGQWLSASNVTVTLVVTSSAQRDSLPAGHNDSINNWMITPERNNRFPSYDATSGPRMINVADWTTMDDRGR